MDIETASSSESIQAGLKSAIEIGDKAAKR